MNLLALDSSILGEHSVSRQLMSTYLDQWQEAHPQGELLYRDLDKLNLPHLSSASLAAAQQTASERSETITQELELASSLLDEFLAADEVILAAPMYNFSIPSQLKAWIDRILVAGKTFKYSEQGPIGLAGDKKLTIISTRGNLYSTNATMQTMDHQELYLHSVFSFIGVSQLIIIRAEGLHLNEELKTQALLQAEQRISTLLAV